MIGYLPLSSRFRFACRSEGASNGLADGVCSCVCCGCDCDVWPAKLGSPTVSTTNPDEVAAAAAGGSTGLKVLYFLLSLLFIMQNLNAQTYRYELNTTAAYSLMLYSIIIHWSWRSPICKLQVLQKTSNFGTFPPRVNVNLSSDAVDECREHARPVCVVPVTFLFQTFWH